MLDGNDYESAVSYFLEEFASDAKFVQESVTAEVAGLLPVLTLVANQALGEVHEIKEVKIFHSSGYNFYHGNGAVGGRALLFFYFDDLDTGIAAFIPGPHGGMEVARFQMKGGLVNPANN